MTTIRRFPVDVRPGHLETRQSYLRRVLHANHEPTPQIAHRGRISAQLARSGRDLSHLDTAIAVTHADGSSCTQCAGVLSERHRCLLCARGADIVQSPHLDQLVCERHSRWIGLGPVDTQRSVGNDHVRAHRVFRKLQRQGRADARLYLLVSSTLSATESEADVFPATVAVIRVLTDTSFLRVFLDRRRDYVAAFAALGAQLDPITDHSTELRTQIWHYLRAIFVRLHRAQLTQSNPEPGWNHEFPFDPAALATLGKGTPEPFSGFLRASGTSPAAANRALLDQGLLPSHPSGVRGHHVGLCAAGHDMPANGNRNQPRCPICLPRFVKPGENDITTKAPALTAQFDVARNAGLHPESFSAGSNQKVWWLCPHAGHSYDATPSNRIANRQECPLCLNRRHVAGVNDLASTHRELVEAEWNPANSILPTETHANDPRQLRFICAEGHSYRARVVDRTSGKGCPECNTRILRSGKASLLDTHPDLIKEWFWSLNRARRPEQFTAGSKEDVWWMCPRGHSFKQRIERRTRGNYGCGKCAKRTLDPEYNSIAATDDGLISEWHAHANELGPTETMSSTSHFWWHCSAASHDYEQTVANRRKSHGCPACPPKDRILNRLAVS